MSAWLLVPCVAGLVGWLTNWMAIRLTLYPARPRRIGAWSVQGLLPRKAERLVSQFTEALLPQPDGAESLLAVIDADRVGTAAVEQLGERINPLLEGVLAAISPDVWVALRPAVRSYWVGQMRSSAPRMVSRVVTALSDDTDRLLDLPTLAAEQVRQRPEVLSEIIWRTGRREFRFIEASGAVIGAVMGLGLAAVWSVIPDVWVLLLSGALVGAVTNWLAIQLVFCPSLPVSLGPFRYQGLIHRRQGEVSRLLASVVLSRMISLGTMLAHLTDREGRFEQVCRIAIREELDQRSLGASTLLVMALGARSSEDAEKAMARAMATEAPRAFADIALSAPDHQALQAALSQRIADMPQTDYGQLMRFMVAEDEYLLVVVGAIVGAIGAFVGGLWV